MLTTQQKEVLTAMLAAFNELRSIHSYVFPRCPGGCPTEYAMALLAEQILPLQNQAEGLEVSNAENHESVSGKVAEGPAAHARV